jgi:hypothetical protein
MAGRKLSINLSQPDSIAPLTTSGGTRGRFRITGSQEWMGKKLFIIRDEDKGTILFIGRMLNPLEN